MATSVHATTNQRQPVSWRARSRQRRKTMASSSPAPASPKGEPSILIRRSGPGFGPGGSRDATAQSRSTAASAAPLTTRDPRAPIASRRRDVGSAAMSEQREGEDFRYLTTAP